ncbi:MAG: class II aldolase/adducin family protein [Pseudomonadota bacterium]
MITRPALLTPEFRALSARLGQDPLQVQGPGGNTSIKDGEVMWIKASGTELANAERDDIFVPVDRQAAIAEARGAAGDGSCKGTVLDPGIRLRPSIETTFHAALDFPVVVHTHSVAAIVHGICPQGRAAAEAALSGLAYALVPYCKPGLPLTGQILARARAETCVFLLENHGLICCGASVAEVGALVAEVERRLALPPADIGRVSPSEDPPEGFEWAAAGWLATDARALSLATVGTYYPDHVVFLGPRLPTQNHAGRPPAVLHPGTGTAIRADATTSQRAMLKCLSDVLARLPDGWEPEPIGEAAEAELLDWDAEKYRQALAART